MLTLPLLFFFFFFNQSRVDVIDPFSFADSGRCLAFPLKPLIIFHVATFLLDQFGVSPKCCLMIVLRALATRGHFHLRRGAFPVPAYSLNALRFRASSSPPPGPMRSIIYS